MSDRTATSEPVSAETVASKLPPATLAAAGPTIVRAKQAPPVAIKPVAAAIAARAVIAGATAVDVGAQPFVPPRAPDDPGPDERDDIAPPAAGYATKTPKRTTH